MSSNPFYHKDARISKGLPCLLAIIASDEAQPYVRADSINDAAGKCLDKMRRPSIMGKKLDRRIRKMRAVIEVAISLGFVTYSQKLGLLELTPKGRRALERRRDRYETMTTRRHLATT